MTTGTNTPGEPQKPKTIHETLEKAAMALAWSMSKDGVLPGQQKPKTVREYRLADGSCIGAVLEWRTADDKKEIRQVSCVSGGWITSPMAEPRPLYRSPEINDAQEVWVCPDEGAVDVAVSLGLRATTSAGGYRGAEKTDWRALNGKAVIMLADNTHQCEMYVSEVAGILRRQAPDATVHVKRLRDDWAEMPEGADFTEWSEHFDGSDPEALADRLQSLQDRSSEYRPTDPSADKKRESRVRSFAGKSVSELWGLADQPVQWLVDSVFSCDQPTIFGAKQKSLKTTLLIDLAVSLASGMPWLGKFLVSRRWRVLYVTGEASEAAAIRKVRRAAQSRNLRREDLGDFLRIEALSFPTLPEVADCIAVASAVEEYDIEVVILDPLYMGLQGLNTSNLTEVGPALRQFMECCRPANVIIAHHVKKSASFDDAPNLEDLSQSGIAEFAGNFWMMGRIGEYVGDGMHKLAVRYGGRDEQFGLLKLDFDERKWKAEFTSLMDHREDMKHRKETEKLNAMTTRILKELKRYPDGVSDSFLASAVGSKPERSNFRTAIEELEQRKAIVCLPQFKAKNKKECLGWKLAS